MLSVSEDVVAKAFARVEAASASIAVSDSKPYSASGGAFDAAFSETWQRIEDMVNESQRQGWEQAKTKLASVVNYISDSAAKLGNRASEFTARVLQKLRAVISDMFDLM